MVQGEGSLDVNEFVPTSADVGRPSKCSVNFIVFPVKVRISVRRVSKVLN